MDEHLDAHPAVMSAGDQVEIHSAGTTSEVFMKAKKKAEKVAWDDSAAEQDTIPAQHGPAQAPSAITAPDFGGGTLTTGYDKWVPETKPR